MTDNGISSYLFTNNLRVHYLKWESLTVERPVLLLHGLASNARIWELTAPRLAQAGLRPLAWDGRGHGLSDAPDGDYGFDTYLRDLSAFIETCGLERPLLVGHSWGGLLALDYAARRPVGPRAPAGIVLVDGGMNQFDDSGLSWEEVRERLTPPRLAGTPLAEFMQLLQQYSRRRLPAKIIDIILANFAIAEDETIVPHLSFERHMQIVRAMWEFPTYERYRQVRCPALLLPAISPDPDDAGEQEYLVLKQRGVQKAQQFLPQVHLHWMKNTIHDIPLQRPARLARLISEFAQSLP